MTTKPILLSGLAAAAIVAGAAASPVQAQDQTHNFDIPAQNLGGTLRALAEQSRAQIIFDGNAVAGKRSPALKGRYSVDAALAILLRGSGLTATRNAEGVLVVARSIAEVPGDAMASEGEAIVVTGTRVRGVDVPAPAIAFGREDFRNSGYSSVQDIFDNLTQNSREISADAALGSGVSDLALSNGQGAAGISLRGLGAESTLVLLNGHRRAGNVNGRVVDISAIPLAIVDRVEIVTGGRSAVYGSDAVAGVVNLVTRQDFEGMESQVYIGTAAKGGERIDISHAAGLKSDRGGIVVAYDFTRDWHFDTVRAGLTGPSPFDIKLSRFDARPENKRHAFYSSGRYRIGDGIELYGDGLYTTESKQTRLAYTGPGFDFSRNTAIRSRQYSAVLGIKADLGASWRLDVSANHGGVRTREAIDDLLSSRRLRRSARLTEISAILDGSLFTIGSQEVKGAFGAEYRNEAIRTPRERGSRNIFSAFGELSIPLDLGAGTIELSAAGRYDRYSDFGSTFNPQAGLVWKPIAGLTLRGAYSRAFRAPSLSSLTQANQAFLQMAPDPKTGGETPVLIWLGGRQLKPETATTWTAGFDYSPPAASWLTVSASYFSINYRNRIDQPIEDTGGVLIDEAVLGSLVDRMPTSDSARAVLDSALNGEFGASGFINMTDIDFDPRTQNPLTVFPNLVVFDNRQSNIGTDKVDGLDAKVDMRFTAGRNDFRIGADATYYLNSTRKFTPFSPKVSRLNRPGQLVDFRLRGSANWTRGAFGLFAYLNYVDGYRDTIATPTRPIGSWTTFDLTARLDGDKLSNAGPLSGVSVTINIDNLFNKRPPLFASNDFGLGYDPANASPLGRYFSLQVTKRW